MSVTSTLKCLPEAGWAARPLQQEGEECLANIAGQQPVSILGEDSRRPDRFHIQADKPSN
jgi:hypothetical protein